MLIFQIFALAGVKITGEECYKIENTACDYIIKHVRKIENCARTPMMLVVEHNGSGNTAGHLYGHIKEFHKKHYPGVHFDVMRERPNNTEGVTKTYENTDSAALILGRELRQVNVRYYKDLVTYEEDPSSVKARFENNLLNLRRVVRIKNGNYKYEITAKTQNSSDDMLISFMMLPYWETRFEWNYSKYKKMHKAISRMH